MTTNEQRGQGIELDRDHPAGRIEDEHRTLRDQLDIVASANTTTNLMAGLTSLPKMLSEHFAGEERVDGLYDDLAKRRPSMAAKLAALRNEHQIILDELDALRREVKTRVEAQQTVEEIAKPTTEGVARWLERLRRHEHDESWMIGDVYYTDEGGFG